MFFNGFPSKSFVFRQFFPPKNLPETSPKTSRIPPKTLSRVATIPAPITQLLSQASERSNFVWSLCQHTLARWSVRSL